MSNQFNAEPLQIISILDRSGSMAGNEQRVISSYNELIEMYKLSVGEYTFASLFLFDHALQPVYEGVQLKQVPPLDSNVYVTRGSTALYDAVSEVITRFMGKKRVFVIIDTDGWDNVSRKTAAELQGLIKECSSAGWEFTFVGADLTADVATRMASSIGLAASSTATFTKSAAGYAARNTFLNDQLNAYSSKVIDAAAPITVGDVSK